MKVNREKLISELSMAKECLSQQTYVPILSHFCFDEGTLTASDGSQSIKIKTSLNISCAVPGSVFLKTLESIPGQEIEIVQNKNNIEIIYGKSKVKLVTLPKKDFIHNIPENIKSKIKIPMDASILEGLDYCFVAVNNNPTSNSDIFGVIFKTIKGRLVIYSSDRKRASRYKTSISDLKSFEILVPLKFCKYLKKYELKGTLSFGKDYILLQSDSTQVYTKIEYEKPMDLENEILSKIDMDNINFCTHTQEFLDILDRCKAFDVKEITLETKESNIIITAKNEFGDIYEELNISDMVFKKPVSFEVSLLSQALKYNKNIGFATLGSSDILVGKKKNCLHVLSSHKEYNN